MQIDRTQATLTLKLSRAEAQAVWGSLLEATHALSSSEFEVRVGEPTSLALGLVDQLKPVLVEWDIQDPSYAQPRPTGE